MLARTLRVEFLDRAGLRERWRSGERFLFVFWHDRVLLLPSQYRGPGLSILNSAHRDGELATRVLQRWGIRSVRGSSTRGGTSGFLGMLGELREGRDLALVPDGPRGPRRRAKRGAVELARLGGVPLVPVTFASRWRVELPTWDRLVLPLPFSRAVVLVGEPMEVPREARKEECERFRHELEQRLEELTREAEARVGREL